MYLLLYWQSFPLSVHGTLPSFCFEWCHIMCLCLAMCICFDSSFLSGPLLSLVCFLIVSRCSVFRSWVVCLYIPLCVQVLLQSLANHCMFLSIVSYFPSGSWHLFLFFLTFGFWPSLLLLLLIMDYPSLMLSACDLTPDYCIMTMIVKFS